MTDDSKLKILREMFESAEVSLRSARELLNEMTGEDLVPSSKKSYAKKAEKLKLKEDENKEEGKVIEGVFDGETMIGKDKRAYPVPANYASKSKLIPGDVLKLTIKEDGTFIYKQIGPVERKRVIGMVTLDDGQYKIATKTKAYKVLLASITYFHAEVGDKATLIVPADEESEWGCIENILPRNADVEID